MHRDGDWHKAIQVWIVNDKDEVLLQRRCPTKDSYPNLLDVSCGGHLRAGDDSLNGAIRELKEELGLNVKPKDLIFMFSDKSSTRPSAHFINNTFYDVYLLRTNKQLSDFTMQPEEISELIYLPVSELKERLERQAADFVPHKRAYSELSQYLEIDK